MSNKGQAPSALDVPAGSEVEMTISEQIPTAILRFEGGLLLQRWDVTERHWHKDLLYASYHKRTDWRQVPGQSNAADEQRRGKDSNHE